jgi:Tol biopolymer transport system component
VGGGFGEIVFTKAVGGNLHLFSIKLGTTEQTRLTTLRSLNIFPAWSPDGKKIAYSWDESPTGMYWRIRIMDADGKNSTQITEFSSAAPHWSPDGKLLVFNSDRGAAGPDIPDPHIANIDGTGVKNLLNSPKTIDAAPKWSPDGKRIAFYSDRGGKFDIYVMDADGKNLTQLTKESGDNSSPAWSRDGKKIAFVSTRDGNSEIYVMNADGSNPMRLTNDPKSDLLPIWSPDGMKIMFASKRTNKGDIYMVNADGSNVVQVTNDPDVDASFGLDWR